jgi:hypothetical protein
MTDQFDIELLKLLVAPSSQDQRYDTWSLAVPVVPEPAPAVPVVQIPYTPTFDLVLSLYRGLLSPAFNEMSPRFAVLNAFALQQCGTHYTCWKNRRDWITSPTAFVQTAWSNWKIPSFLSESEQSGLQKLLRHWCPGPNDFAEGGTYCPLRALRFELRVQGWFCENNPKNFQVLNHRKELSRLVAEMKCAHSSPCKGLLDVTTAIRIRGDLVIEKLSLSDHNEECRKGGTEVKGSDLDDRPLTESLFKNDSKNYHAWSYRAWMVGYYPAFLLNLDAWKAEVEFTATLIEKDPFNNSAWCHRYFLFRLLVDPPRELAARPSPPYTPLTQLIPDPLELEAQLLAECNLFTHRWIVWEPNNESPFNHSRGILDLLCKLWKQRQESGGEEFSPGNVCDRLRNRHSSSAALLNSLWVGIDQPDVLLHLIYGVHLQTTLQPEIDTRNPKADEDDSTAKKENRPSLKGSYYGRHLDTAVVNALEYTAHRLPMGPSDSTADPQLQPLAQLRSFLHSAIVELFSRLEKQDELRTKYWVYRLASHVAKFS